MWSGQNKTWVQYTNNVMAADAIDVVTRVEDPDSVLGAIFGVPYSKKLQWPEPADSR
jgi:hypothetical protein